MWETLRKIWKTPEVRNSLLFVFVMLVIFRVIAHVPLPGIDTATLAGAIAGNQFFGLLNIFSGGTLTNFSVAALGVAPYITASIIFQLLGMIIPKMEELQKEEQGRQKINQWTRYITVPLAALQAYSLILLLEQQSGISAFSDGGVGVVLLAIACMTAGTVFLIWIGELISEKNIGNGLSILILAGIVAGLPSFLGQSFAIFDRSQVVTFIVFVLITLATIVAVVVMNEAQRNVPVQYARQVRGSRLRGAVTSHLPLRLNMGGVIPIIFAISMLLFPSMIAQFFVNARTEVVRQAATWVLQVFQNQTIYGIVYFVLVFSFSYFYTAIVFQPDNVAENLQKQGGFVPGIRPGKPTAQYLQTVTNRLLFAGALFLSLIAILPLLMQQATGNATLVVGGTSILIVVSVIIESVKQAEAQLTLRQYDQV